MTDHWPAGPTCDDCGNDITPDGRGHDACCPTTDREDER